MLLEKWSQKNLLDSEWPQPSVGEKCKVCKAQQKEVCTPVLGLQGEERSQHEDPRVPLSSCGWDSPPPAPSPNAHIQMLSTLQEVTSP